MIITKELSGLFDLVRNLWGVYRQRRDPFRCQAERILAAFKAHGIAPTQIGRLSPAPPLDKLSVLAYPEHLKEHLSPAFVLWVQETLQLEQSWLDGTSSRPYQRIYSYKCPGELHGWLSQRHDPKAYELRFTLHIFKQDERPLGSDSQGPFVAVLEERFAELNDQDVSRYYYLTEGAHFEHYPCIIHLLQILALAHHHRMNVKGWVMPLKRLRKLDEGHDLLPNLWHIDIRRTWHPDDALWPHMSGRNPWLEEARRHLDEALGNAGQQELVAELSADRQRWGKERLGQQGASEKSLP